MSLGLKDLQKKRRTQQPNLSDIHGDAAKKGAELLEKAQKAALAKEIAKNREPKGGDTVAAKPAPKTSFGRPSFGVRPKIPASVWANKTVTARPWTDNGLSKGSRGRRSILDPEAAMNEDWINLFSTPWFWVECAPESRLIRLQQQLANLEEQIEQRIRSSIDAVLRFIGA